MNMLRTALSDGTTLLMPNVWDVRSAQVALESGFSVVGTSSAAIAAVLGGGDAEQTSVDDMVGWNRRIVRAVSPSSVNVDLESGYGLSAAEIADVVRDIGCAGINIEDSNHDGDGSQLDRKTQAIKLAEIGAHFEKIPGRPVLTARVDSTSSMRARTAIARWLTGASTTAPNAHSHTSTQEPTLSSPSA